MIESAALTPLLERERELATIERAIDRAAGGEGSLVLIEGPAGIGKTRLLSEAKSMAERRGFLIRWARGGELERGMPFGVARQLFEPVIERAGAEQRKRILAGSARQALIALGASDDGAERPADPFAPIHGLYWLLSNLADDRPVLLGVDDIHWADSQTLRYLDYLSRRLADTSVLVIANVRLGEPGSPAELEQLRPEAMAVYPEPLSPEAIGELISQELGKAGTQIRNACAEATAGNPFLLNELLRALRDDQISIAEEAAPLITRLAPKTVSRQVLTRLGRFGAEAIAISRAIAVLGGSPQLRHAATLAGIAEEQAGRLCDGLREAEILAQGLPLDFVHPLIRQAIYGDLSEGERSAIHRRAAEILNQTGASAREIAPHLMTCAPNGDQWVVTKLGDAAWEAIRSGAYDAAVSYLRRALEEPPDNELPIRFALGRALIQVDPVQAGPVLDELTDGKMDAPMRRRVLRDTAMAYFMADDWQTAAQRFEALIEALPETDAEQRLAIEAQRMMVDMGRVHVGIRVRTSRLERARAAAAALHPDSPARSLARQAIGMAELFRGTPVDEVVDLIGSFPPPPWNSRTMVSLGACLGLATCGHWDRGRSEIIRIEDQWQGMAGMASSIGYADYFRGECERRAGKLADAEARARAAIEMLAAVSISNPGSLAKTSLLSTLLDRGEIEEARRLARGVDLSAGASQVGRYPWPLELRGQLQIASGELEGGVSDLLHFGEGAEQAMFLNPASLTWRQASVPALVMLDRTDEARRIVVVAEERARSFGAPHVIGIVLRARASTEPKGKAVHTLRESAGFLEHYGPPHELARSLLELGSLLRRMGSRSEAREPLERALELAARSGAGGTERRAREELAAIGSRPRSAYRTGVSSLTASELRVAKLAAEGLNNREIAERLFVTRRTVETHLTHVYSKLEIEGRARLAEAIASKTPPT